MSTKSAVNAPKENTRGRVLFASLIGTTIEFFDFYAYATASVLVFPTLFFPNASNVERDPFVVCHLRRRLRGPPGGLGSLRPLR